MRNQQQNTTNKARTCADKIKVNLPQPQERPTVSKTEKEKTFPLKDNEMTFNQQLQLILEKLYKQEKTNKLLVIRSRLDRL
jgi:hypothetical protein